MLSLCLGLGFYLHDTWGDGIDSDAIWSLLLSKTACEGRDCTLGGAVVDELWVAHVRGDGAGVDDGAAALHVLEGVLAHGEHGEDVGAERAFHDGEIDVLEVLADLLHGAVVDEDAELAEGLDVLLDGFLAVFVFGQVERHEVGFAAGLFDVRFRPLGVFFLLGEVDDGHVGTFTGHQDGDAAADTRVATSDKNGLVLE